MKNIYFVKRFGAVAVLLLMAVGVFAQSALRTGYFLQGNPYRYRLNAALMNDQNYIALPVLIGVFFELFGWHRRAYLYGTDIFGYVLTFVLIVALFAFAGAIMTRGKKNRIISAIVCPAIWLVSYAVIVFIINNLIYTGSAAAACIGAQYVVTGIEAFVILIITLRNLIKDKSKNS